MTQEKEETWELNVNVKLRLYKNVLPYGNCHIDKNIRLSYTAYFSETLFFGSDMSLILLYILLSIGLVFCRPAMQRIIVNNHEWEVPDEPGWDEVVKEAESVQRRLFRSCRTVAECGLIVDEMHAVFNRYPVSRKYLESNSQQADDILASIFKWG